jgi:hypothetical protein
MLISNSDSEIRRAYHVDIKPTLSEGQTCVSE